MRKRFFNHQLEPRRFNPLAIILLALIALLLTPNLAWAQTSYGITVKHNGTNYRVTSANASDVLGDGKVTYNVTNSVLTLDNAIINGCIYFNSYDPTDPDGTLNGTFTIWIKGTCIITASDSCAIKNTTTLSLDSNSGEPAYPNSQNTARGTVNLIPLNEGGNLTMTPKGNPSVGLFQYVSNSDERLGDQDGILVIYSQLFSGGVGTDTDPYIIGSAYDLKNFATFYNNGLAVGPETCVKLGNDIDCTGITIETIGDNSQNSPAYSGTFDGNDHTISNLTITPNSIDVCGLFSHLYGGTIQDLTLSNCTISGGQKVGAFVGHVVGGSISNCHTSGCTVSSDEGETTHAGGIAGCAISSDGTISISGCTVTSGSVTASTDYSFSSGYSYAGGILGEGITNTATISISGCEVNSTTITSHHTCNNSALISGGIVGNAQRTNASFTISNNIVKGNTKITYLHSAEVMSINCGAIAGYSDDDVTYADNTYEYGVITYNNTTGYVNRGIGNNDADVIGQVELAGTKKITISLSLTSPYGEYMLKENTFYLMDDGDVYVLPGYDVTINSYPAGGYKPRMTLSDNTIDVTATDVENPDTHVYDHTEFTLTMPNANLTATLAFPIDIASASYTASIADGLYTGDPVVPTRMTLNDGTDDIILTTADDFTITGYTLGGTAVDEPVEAGTYTVTVEGKNDYIGTRNVSYKIAQVYALTIDGIQVNEVNKDNIIKSAGAAATVSFTPATTTTPNTLTLNGAAFEGSIESGLDELTIEFTGTNSLNGTSGYITSTNPSAALTLKGVTNGTNPSTLSLTNTVGVAAVEGFVSVTLNDGSYLKTTNCCQYVSGDVRQYQSPHNNMPIQDITFTTKPYYLLWIRDYQVSDDNKDDIFNDAQNSNPISATFNPSSNILTLNGLESGSQFGIESGLDNLTISLIGDNNISASYHADYNAIFSINENATLTIQKAGDAECNLGLSTYGQDPVIKGFKSVSYTGLNFVSKTGATLDGATTYDAVLSSATIYPLWVDGTMVTEVNKAEILDPGNTTVSFDNNTLTLNGFNRPATYSDVIETGIEGLKVKLVGVNTVETPEGDYSTFVALNESASIEFEGEGSLDITTFAGSPFIDFGEGKITYNKLVSLKSGTYAWTIAPPTAPTMTEDNNKVKLTREAYEGGTIAIKYSIDYADNTEDVTGATYSEPFAMAAPGTVTAWVEANGATTSTVKGKYFGYKDAPFTLKVDDTLTPELIPAFVNGENIGYTMATTPYSSSATDVATFTNGTIAGTGIGTATLTATIDYTSDNQPVVILNPEKKVTAEVNVGMVPSISFADGMTYATYCNTSEKDLTVPEGLTAYAITGTNGNVVTLAEVGFLPKVDGTDCVALLLKRDDTSAAVGLALETAGGTRPTTNYLRYNNTNAAINVEDNMYVLYKEEFLKANGTIPAGKCYLVVSGGAGARSLSISHGEGENTGIDNLMLDEDGTEKWYDLRGRRIEKPTKAGLYIRNGEKIVINDNNK